MVLKKKIKIIIIIIIFFIAFICVRLLKMKDSLKVIKEPERISEVNYNIMQEVVNVDEYFNINECISRYFKYIRETDAVSLMEILDKDYVKNMMINEDNVFKYTYEGRGKKLHYYIKDMKVKYSANIIQYVIDCKVSDEEMQNNIFFLVLVDEKTNSFGVLPINESVNDITNVKIKDSLSTIEKNTKNNYIHISINDEWMCKFLLEDYIKNALYFPSDLYNSLDEEYRNKRFPDYESFKKYINYNKSRFETSVLADLKKIDDFNSKEEYLEYLRKVDKIQLYKFLVEKRQGGNRYICMDKNENYYIFDAKKYNKYAVILDTYTITSDKFKSEYNQGNDTKKCQLNIDKFVKMINSKDYVHAYKVLDEGFKKNYFNTEDEFEKFVSSHFFEFNDIKFKNVSIEGDVYIFKVILIDKNNTNNTLDINIFIKLKNDLNFVMSFGKA